jgi:hypothetical protein
VPDRDFFVATEPLASSLDRHDLFRVGTASGVTISRGASALCSSHQTFDRKVSKRGAVDTRRLGPILA